METAKFRLDLRDERLWHGDRPVHVGNKALQLLRLFVDNPGRLLTKDEILDGVWHEVCVSEGLIKEYVHDLRLALGDDPKRPQFIETVRGRGYRFLGGVETVGRPLGDDRQAPSAKPSLAVLPFENLSGDPEEEYFSDGITEDIITELSRFRSIFVIARNSSFAYKGGAARVQEVGRDLGVRYLVEGSVRRAGERVRVTAQLIETATGRHLWADRYDRDLVDIFALQDEITRTIAAAVEPELGHVERERSRRKSPASLDAWDWYQRGLSCLYQETRAGNSEALRQFEQALKLSPDFAPACAASAMSCVSTSRMATENTQTNQSVRYIKQPRRRLRWMTKMRWPTSSLAELVCCNANTKTRLQSSKLQSISTPTLQTPTMALATR